MRMGTIGAWLREHRNILLFPIIVLAIHSSNALFTTYGIFRDELYYIACSLHPAAGYVDHPPFSIILLRVVRTVFGDSLFVLRFVPALAHALTVLLSAIIARQLNGGRRAQFLAGAVTAFAPGIMGMTGIYSMNAVEIALWSIAASLFLRMEGRGSLQQWTLLGLLLGTGLMNKVSMGWLAAGLTVGIIATPMRSVLRTRGPWITASVAVVLFLPFILWNLQNDLAHMEFARNAAGFKYASQNILTFLTGLVTLYNPLAVPVWITGFWMLLRQRDAHRRALGIAMVTVLAILLVNVHSKSEYFNPAAVILIAAGSVWWEQHVWSRFARTSAVYAAAIILTGILLLPLSIDLLPQERLGAYMQRLHVPVPNTEGHTMGALPQHFADRHGWKELAASVGSAFAELPAGDRSYTAVYVRNYGEAAAIDLFGGNYGLPKALCGHNSYWLWGKERLEDSVQVLIAVGGRAEDYSDTFGDIRLVRVHHAAYVMPYENDLPIFVCRDPRQRIREVWHTTKHFQ